MQNLISAQISDEDLKEVLQAIALIKQKLPFLQKLSKRAKKSTSMLKDKRIPFASKALDYAEHVSNLSPNPELLAEAQKDSALFEKLQSVDREMQQLSEMITDTRMLAGAEFYDFARIVYKMSKIAVSLEQPGSQSIVDNLGELYASQGKPIAEKVAALA